MNQLGHEITELIMLLATLSFCLQQQRKFPLRAKVRVLHRVYHLGHGPVFCSTAVFSAWCNPRLENVGCKKIFVHFVVHYQYAATIYIPFELLISAISYKCVCPCPASLLYYHQLHHIDCRDLNNALRISALYLLAACYS